MKTEQAKYVRETLEALDQFFRNGNPVHPGALLTEGDETIEQRVLVSLVMVKGSSD